jgi:cell division protein ZapA
MAQVTVMIDGKAYRMACEEGQESHLTELAAKFDRYVAHLKTQFGEIGDLRLTVMSGIMIMDELSEVNRRLAAAETELDGLRKNRDSLLATSSKTDELMVSLLGELTQQIHSIANKLSVQGDGKPVN